MMRAAAVRLTPAVASGLDAPLVLVLLGLYFADALLLGLIEAALGRIVSAIIRVNRSTHVLFSFSNVAARGRDGARVI